MLGEVDVVSIQGMDQLGRIIRCESRFEGRFEAVQPVTQLADTLGERLDDGAKGLDSSREPFGVLLFGVGQRHFGSLMICTGRPGNKTAF
jgi:hypothetical protein